MRTGIISTQAREKLLGVLTGPPILAFVPALSLASFWLGGEVALATVALGIPLIFAGAGAFGFWSPQANHQIGLYKQVMPKAQFQKQLEFLFNSAVTTGTNSVCIAFAIDNISEISEQYGQATAEVIWSRCRERAMSIIRGRDISAQIDNNCFAIALRPSPHLDLEASISLSGRLQAAIEEPVQVRGASIFASCSIGFCMTDKVSGGTADQWLEAAVAALAEASRNGPSTIRAYTLETKRRTALRADLKTEFSAALTAGEIRPWFQPQISTETGQITGFEALARWEHSGKGTLGPHVFLPFAEQSGLMEQLGHSMRRHAFAAIRTRDDAGLAIPRVGVNFSADELRNPALVDRLKWELDEFDLTPGRLSVEVLETVFSNQPDDIISRNIACLADLGCCIDLDDFGTGHASIASIKRFDVTRIKIDRSFVAKADKDPRQQQMVGAILIMADQLGLETLGEGVETPGEHALLAQLGCDHVQGFGIGKPMPLEKTVDWISQHRKKLEVAPKIGRRTG